ncbi:Do family serine endopeptidase [Dyella sp. A6]|uniref:Do family serine endopeptidase n=1 Tax=Dyella aluminiiresistens TaxID=3069105 RepID=UPI002E792936|nr:Do family serine endopeptidase [Dyella sp. A6]
MPQRHRPSRWLAAAFVALLGGTLSAAGHAGMPPEVNGQPLPSLAPMLQHVTPAVVNISTRTRVAVRNPYFDDPVFRQFFGLSGTPREKVKQSLGSGVIVNATKGYILTNNHVVGGADDITVTLQDGRSFKGHLVGTDPATDIAVVKIDADHLQALPLADSSKLRVGDFVVAVGEPFGLSETVTSGIVSALGRSGLGGSGYQNFIQTDASINPGNSGGALVNLRGQLVGINSMIFSPSGGNVGIGFAIPSNLAAEVMKQLIAHGKVSRGTLGIQTRDISPRIARMLGLLDDEGVVVTNVTRGSSGDRAGLQIGDVITALDGKPLHDSQQLHNTEGLQPVGTVLHLTVHGRHGDHQVDATLALEKLATVEGRELDPRLAGVTFSELDENQRNQGVAGVAVSAVRADSAAAQAGLGVGDIVVAVGNYRVTSIRDIRRLAGVRPRQLVLVVAGRNGLSYVPIP